MYKKCRSDQNVVINIRYLCCLKLRKINVAPLLSRTTSVFLYFISWWLSLNLTVLWGQNWRTLFYLFYFCPFLQVSKYIFGSLSLPINFKRKKKFYLCSVFKVLFIDLMYKKTYVNDKKNRTNYNTRKAEVRMGEKVYRATLNRLSLALMTWK